MKRSLFFMALALCAASFTQAQMPKWSNPPVLFDWATHTQTTTPTSTSGSSGNAAYDANGNLLFYVDGNALIDDAGFTITNFSSGPYEVNIVKVPNTCKDYYVIYSGYSGIGGANAYYFRLTWSGFTWTPSSSTTLPNIGGAIWCNMAVSKLLNDKSRYLFISQTSKLCKYQITNTAITYVNTVATGTAYAGYIFTSNEGELFEDASGYKYVTSDRSAGPSNPKIGIITMNASGNYVSKQNYNSVNGIVGLEFVNSNQILMTTRSSNTQTYLTPSSLNISTGAVTNLTNVANCLYADIEKAADGKYYTLAKDGSDKKLLELNPSTLTTSLTSYVYNLGQASPDGLAVAKLPDQVDNENYVTAEYQADLISKDDVSDIGTQPNALSSNIWASDDIWNVRTTSSSPLVHENPGYTGAGNVMKLRITNAGCVTSAPSHAKMYWTLGATGETWPNAWTGTPLCTGNPNGGGELIVPYGTTTYTSGQGFDIGPLAPGQSQILESKWQPVDPAIYSCTGITLGPNPMICFLGRIVGAADPMYNEANGPISANVRNNNNIVTRNTTLVSLPGNFLRVIHGGGGVLVTNYLNEAAAFNIHIRNVPGNGGGVSFNNLGEMTLQVSQNFYESWQAGGGSAVGLSLIDPQSYIFRVTNISDATFNNVMIGADEVMSMQADFSLSAPTTVRDTYVFDVSQGSVDDDLDYSSHCSYIVSIVDGGEDDGSDGARGNKVATNMANVVGGNAAVTVTPNPAHDVLNMSITSTDKDVVTVEVFDIMGRTAVKSIKDYAVQKGTTSLQLPVSDLANGMYLVRITGTHISSYSKIEVHH